MKIEHWIEIFIALILLSAGFLVGHFVADIPYVDWKNQISYSEAANFIIGVATLAATIVIAYLVPKNVSRVIEDMRGVKKFIVDDIVAYLELAKCSKSKISELYSGGLIGDDDKKQIIVMFNDIELKLNSVVAQIALAFPTNSKAIVDEIKNAYFDYDAAIAGGPLMSEQFTRIDETFFGDCNLNFAKFETRNKAMVQKIFKL